jgi:hypothetical protein
MICRINNDYNKKDNSNPHLTMVDPALQRAGAREIARETRTPYNLQELKNKEI